jgi:hypothetical protein
MRGILKSEKSAAGRRNVYTGLGITGVCLLFAAAMLFPKWYHRFQDNLTMQQVNDMDLSFDMYETAYDSFYDKLDTLARCAQAGTSLRVMKVAEINYATTDENLTKIVKNEWEVLYNKGVLNQTYEFDAESLTEREVYTIYTTKEGEEIAGINYWKLTYDLEECRVEIYLDTDFHKIYEIQIMLSTGQETDAPNEQNEIKESLKTNDMYTWAEGITLYYGLTDWMFEKPVYQYSENKQYIYDASSDEFGIVAFTESGMLDLAQFETEENGTKCWSIGIPLENMLQF